MRVYFLRHADAVDGADDAIRPLSTKGRQQCRALGQWLQSVGIEFDAVVTSPLVRARQTAELVLKVAPPAAGTQTEVSDMLLNEATAASFTRWLKDRHRHQSLLLVGHAPTLAERAASLLGMSRPDSLKLPKAGLICVETENARTGELRCFITPKFLA